jgi:methylmalonyl-CoA mutase
MTRSSGGPQPPAEERLLEGFPAPSLKEWEQECAHLLVGAPYAQKLLTSTYEGITLRPLYVREDAAGLPHLNDLPGAAPYRRGTHPLGHLQAPWWVAQELPYPDYETFNRCLRQDLERGQTAVNLLLDEATQAGRDPDQAAVGEVGKGGTSIASVIGLEKALAGVDLSRVPLLVQAGSAALPFAALVVALLRRRGQDPMVLRGSLGMDPICGLAQRGKLPLSLQRAYDELALLTRWAKDHAPRMRTVAAYGFPWHEGGGSAVQELAFTLAAAVQHLRELEQRGLGIQDVGPRLLFGLEVGPHFFLEIAKLRAARLLWARVAEACGGDAMAQQVFLHVRSSPVSLTAVDPWVNILRGTTEAFAAIVGGCDSLHVAPFDEALGLPGELARRLARNTQLVLREEAHFDRVVDPAGGSWYVESLTAELAEKAWALFQEIEQEGGLISALAKELPQRQVAATAALRRQNTATRQDVLVGVNRYPDAAEVPPVAEVPDLVAFHAARTERLQELRTSAEHTENLKVLEKLGAVLESSPVAQFEAVVEAAAQGATIGEFTQVLRHGEDDRPVVMPVKSFRAAAGFEALRHRVESWRERTGRTPQVFLANLGPLAGYMPRLDFARSFFQIGGFAVADESWFATPAEAAKAALASGAPVVAIVSTDVRYAEAVPLLAAALKQGKSAPQVMLAGRASTSSSTGTATRSRCSRPWRSG